MSSKESGTRTSTSDDLRCLVHGRLVDEIRWLAESDQGGKRSREKMKALSPLVRTYSDLIRAGSHTKRSLLWPLVQAG